MSTDFNIIHLRNTRSYDPDGSYVSTGRVFTAGTNGEQLWTNDLNLNNLSVSTLTLQSSLTVTNMVVQSTLTTSTLLTGTATFSQKSQFNTGVSIKGSPAGSWDVVTEYTDINYQNLIFSDSTSPTKVITFRGNSGKIACSGLTASKILISDQYQTITASNTDSIKVIYLDNVSSDIQTQLNSKLNLSGGNLTGALDMGSNKITSTYSPVNGPDLTNKTFVDTADALKANLSGGNSFSGSQNYSDKTLNSVAIFDGSKNLTSSAISTTELNYISGVTSAIQTQLNTKAPTSYVNDADALRVAKTGDTMTGNLLMGANSITSTADPTTNDQLSRKGYVDTADGLRVLKSGDTMGGQLSVYNETSDIDSRYILNTFLRGWSSFNAGSEADLTYTVSSSGSVGSQVVRTDKYVWASGPKIRLDKLKTYQVEFNIRRMNASSTSGATFFLVIQEYTWNGVNISGDGNQWYYPIANIAQSSLTAPVWYNYKASVGPNGGKAHASNAFFISVGFIVNYENPATPDTIEMSGFKIYPIEDDIRSILTVSGIISKEGITGKEGIFNTRNTAASANFVLTLRDNTTIPHKLFFTPNLPAGNYNNNVVLGDFGIFTNYDDGPTGSSAIALGPWNGPNLVRITPTNTQFYGNVGIGITNPTEKLTVTGNALVNGSLRTYGNSGGGGAIFAENAGTGDSYAVMFLRNNNTATGCYWFLNSTTRTTEGGANTATLRNDAGSLRLMSLAGAGILINGTTGNVGIGQSNPQWKLHVSNTNAWNDGGYLKADGIIGVGGKDNNPDYQYVVFPNPSQFDGSIAGMYRWSSDMITGRYKNEFRVAWWKETHGAPAGSAYKEGITMFLTDSDGYVNLDYIKLNGNTRVNGDISLGKFGNPGTGGTAFGDERSRYSIKLAGYRDVLSNRLGAKISVVNRVGSDGTNMNMSDLTFATTPNAVYGEDATVERMVIKADGNVGIGTTNPSCVLDVRETINTGAFYTPTFQVLGSTSSDGSCITNFQCQASFFGRNIVYMTGRFQEGNDAWTFATPRNGITFRTQSSLDSAYTNRWTIQNYGDGLGFLSSNTPTMVLKGSNVGIGTTDPNNGRLCVLNSNASYVTQKINHNTSANWALWIQFGNAANQAANFILFHGSNGNQRGSITSSGDNTISYNTGSDSRFKENIKILDNPRQYIDQLRPCSFNMIGDTEQAIGFIAQEVKGVFPNMVTHGDTPEKYLYLDYSKFSPIAIAGVKQLFQEKDALVDRVSLLEASIAEKSAQLDALLAWARNQGFSS